MLTINMHNDKLAAARVDFTAQGMLHGTCLSKALQSLHQGLSSPDLDNKDGFNELGNNKDGGWNPGHDLGLDNEDNEDDLPGPVDGPPIFSEVTLALRRGLAYSPGLLEMLADTPTPAPRYPCTSFQMLGEHIGQANLDDIVRCFLFYEQSPTFNGSPLLSQCPTTSNTTKIQVFHSATTTFCTPSNPSGVGGLYHETIRSTPQWQTGDIVAPRRDCVLLNTDPDVPGMRGLDVAHVHLFFSFELGNELFSCALVHHFSKTFDEPDPDNGLWVVEPDFDRDGYRIMSVIHADSIVRATHLLPVFKGDAAIPRNLNFSHTLNVFTAFYVNKYIDYHAFETLS